MGKVGRPRLHENGAARVAAWRENKKEKDRIDEIRRKEEEAERRHEARKKREWAIGVIAHSTELRMAGGDFSKEEKAYIMSILCELDDHRRYF